MPTFVHGPGTAHRHHHNHTALVFSWWQHTTFWNVVCSCGCGVAVWCAWSVDEGWHLWAAIAKAQPISRFHGRDADREMDGSPWNGQFSVKFCNFARSLMHFLNIIPMPVLCSAFAITFTQIINNYLLKCNPFALCLLTVQQSSDVTLNMEAERSVSQYTAANSAQRQWLSMSKCNLANQVIIAKNSKTANNWAEKLVVATDKLN